MIPSVLPIHLVRTLKEFDRVFRSTAAWVEWEKDAEHEYVIVNETKFYPINRIVVMATGAATDSFTHSEARQYLAGKGLRTVLQSEERVRIDNFILANPKAARPKTPVRSPRSSKSVKS